MSRKSSSLSSPLIITSFSPSFSILFLLFEFLFLLQKFLSFMSFFFSRLLSLGFVSWVLTILCQTPYLLLSATLSSYGIHT